MKKIFFFTKGISLALIFLLCTNQSLFAQKDNDAFQWFTAQGKKTSYKKLIKSLQSADVVLFGELHNDPIAHWQQNRVAHALQSPDYKLKLGFEMLERDQQLIVSEYQQQLISEKNFTDQARLWPNQPTDYQPLMRWARENKIELIATNIPRRYASLVYRKGLEGLESLSSEAKTLLAPLPIKVDTTQLQYRKMKQMMGQHGGYNIVYAQAVKDATMAYFIAQQLDKNTKFIHFHGSYHSDFHEGITTYLKALSPESKIITIATVKQGELKKLSEEHLNQADYVLVVADDMTNTHQ
ncbi:ChaN family lipoprotein [Persicobacter psychrovividus]|uniref:Haem-binding uptake Tiki superfamily ChaN domain-containing protein n=1 Tax=Persicobacter psychrovividus TaxID=387638 RepID=A0ABN6LEU9_9BACT|nr:hypothetical protein PEPS_37860 [Persicobacter psychrovividus]